MKAAGSPGLAEWLVHEQVSLGISTYRANRLMFLGSGERGALKIHERLFDRPMGLCAADSAASHQLWMAGRSHLWRFDNILAAGERHEGADRLYVPAASFTTADVNAHDVALLANGEPLFVNTSFSCLATLHTGASFAPVWKPPFISRLAPEDSCHLNGVAVVDGAATWATACGHSDKPASWRDHRNGGGVLMHVPSNSVAVTGLAMPHSPRWHGGKVWLVNSGTGELGFISGERFEPVCFLPGFGRGLAFVGGFAVVGISKLRSPQFTGLPLEERLQGGAAPGGVCGLQIVDLETGRVAHTLELPDPIDELFDVVALPGAREPRAVGLQAEDIHCLVKLPGRDKLVVVRPKAPDPDAPRSQPVPLMGTPEASSEPVRYQEVHQLTQQTLAPYAALTFPSLAPNSRLWSTITGELVGVSAMVSGTMVGLALAERKPGTGNAILTSLMVAPEHRGRGVATRLVMHLERFLAKEDSGELAVRYAANSENAAAFERLLQRTGWQQPQTDFILIQGTAEKAMSAGWDERYALKPPYATFPWVEMTPADADRVMQLGAPPELLPPRTMDGLDPATSVGLRHDGRLVGWAIAHRIDEKTVRYSTVYVAPAHRVRGQGIALLGVAFRRQHAAGIPIGKAAINVRNDEFLRVHRRHLVKYVPVVGESRSSRKRIMKRD